MRVSDAGSRGKAELMPPKPVQNVYFTRGNTLKAGMLARKT